MTLLRASARTLAFGAIAAALLVIVAGPVPSARRTPRTPNGRPDLQGIWLNNTATPLERLKDFSDRPFFTEKEAREYEKHYLLDRAALANIDNPFELEVGADVDVMEPGRVLRNRRTSLIVDPPDGKIPAPTPEARRRSLEQSQQLKTHFAENPEDLRLGERCLMIAGSPAGPPMLPVYYNNNIQIVQTQHDVMVFTEMIHDARVISLDRSYSSAADDSAVEGRFNRPLGGRYPHRRHDEFHGKNDVPRVRRRVARRGTLYAERHRHPRLQVHYR